MESNAWLILIFPAVSYRGGEWAKSYLLFRRQRPRLLLFPIESR